LGRAVLESQRRNTDPILTILDKESGQLLMTGKIVDLERHLRGGFAVGHVYLEGFGDHESQRGEIRLQNEFLVFSRNGEVEVCVPDLIVVLEADTGLPITTEMLRYGQRVAVVALPCHDLLRSKEALEVIGPAAFGYPEITYTPLSRNPTTQGVR
ncbi:MAG: DUF917 domain-containing protein, partial [bacterium]